MNRTTGIEQGIKHWTITWVFTTLVVFVVLVFFGWAMRFNQAGIMDIPGEWFYAFMTLHGLGMAGVLYTASLAMMYYVISKYVKPSQGINWIVYVLVIWVVVGLLIATLIGRFGAGWYVLYPLPFIQTWYHWAGGLTIISVMVLTFVWLLWQLDMLRAIISKYGFGNMLGWQYLGAGGVHVETPPVIIIASVSLISGTITVVFGAILMILYLFQWLDPNMSFDPLLLKNMVFLFGHTIVNVSMYVAIAVVYELLPRFTGRPWKSNRIVSISWNVTLILVMIAFLHHLYFDFSQPLFLQYVGQFASYLSTVPATVVTVFGIFAQLYRSGTKMSYVPLTFIFGVMGWIVGGFAAVVDSTVLVNIKFHNTLWVPAHFHTYFIVGYILIFFGFIYYLVGARSEQTAKVSLWTMLIGGYGFVLMFYFAGVLGVPRRYANYASIKIPAIVEAGETFASLSVYFIGFLIFGIFIYFGAVLGNLNEYVAEPLPPREL